MFGQGKLLRIMIRYGYLGVSAYYYVKEDKLDPWVRKSVFVGFKKGVKATNFGKYEKFILSRDVTFDEASMVKPTNSQ